MSNKNKYPGVEDAKAIAGRHDCEMVIVFFQKGKQSGYASYGKDRRWCNAAREIADEMFEHED